MGISRLWRTGGKTNPRRSLSSALAGVSAPAEFLFRQPNGFSYQHAALSGRDASPTFLANDVIDAQSLAELEFRLF